MEILLDTCTLIFALENKKRLSEKAQEILMDSTVYLSSISAFEIGLLVRKGQITLPYAPEVWLQKAFETYNLHEIQVNNSIALRSTQLPEHHRDPTDRIIISTAIEYDFTLLTPDEKIHKYEGVKVIW